MISNIYKSDNIVVGGGIAGIVTALELLSFEEKVIVLDRDVEEKFGGLAKLSFGGMFFVNSEVQRRMGIKDSVDLALRDWFSVAEFKEDDVLPKKWAELFVSNTTEHVYNYLKKHKVGFFPVVQWVERGMFKPGNSVPRFHMVWGTGHELSNKLRDHLLNHPKAKTHLQIYFNHRVEEIITENGTVKGVRGYKENNNEPFEAYAENTVVATGGLGGDIEQVKNNWYKGWGKAPDVILNGAHPFADGKLHYAVQKVNGKLTHLDFTWPYAGGVHHPRPTRPNDGLSTIPPRSALWLNYQGKRFGPVPLVTAYDTKFLVEEICKEEKKYSWQVMNMKILNKEFAISGAESNPAFKNKSYFEVAKVLLFGNKPLANDMLNNCKDFVTGNTIDELVNKMNELNGDNEVKAEYVKQAIAEYDAQIDRGESYFNDDQLRRIQHLRSYFGDKSRTCKFQKINDSKQLPLVAIREFILSRKTMGGIQTDLKGRVLNTSGESINGLYAVGEAAGYGGGGIHGKGALEGTFLGTCILTARIAAYNIAGKTLL